MIRGENKFTTKGQGNWGDKFMTGLEKYISSKCPNCGESAKPINNNPGWYYCHNPSCNMTAFQNGRSQYHETLP